RRLGPGSWAGLTSPTDRPVLIQQWTATVRTSAKRGHAALAASARRIQPNPSFPESPVSHPILLSCSFALCANHHASRPKTAKITESRRKNRSLRGENRFQQPNRTIILNYYFFLDSVDLLGIIFRTVTDAFFC